MLTYENIKQWYNQKLWSAVMVYKAVEKGVITIEQYNEIVKE